MKWGLIKKKKMQQIKVEETMNGFNIKYRFKKLKLKENTEYMYRKHEA